ncbi:MAG: hypothetical protein IID08_00575 [Candidatus Hydrogenedentes bacterium]|nr:hypothetical protein [Candidatus Hydrogenedentota bacterium]
MPRENQIHEREIDGALTILLLSVSFCFLFVFPKKNRVLKEGAEHPGGLSIGFFLLTSSFPKEEVSAGGGT